MQKALYTENAKAYRDNVFSDNVNVLINAFDIINFYNYLPYNIKEEYGSDWLWNELLKKIQSIPQTSNLSEIFFETPNANLMQLLSKWNEIGNFDKWLIWLWLKLEPPPGYLTAFMQKSSSYEFFVQDLACGIIDLPVNEVFSEFYLDRKRIIETIQLEELPPIFWEKLEEITDTKKLFYLTDVTQKERENIISLVGKINLTDGLKEILQYAYPNLYLYLGEYAFSEQHLTDYFNKYKLQKVRNVFTDDFIKTVIEFADQKGVWWNLKPRNTLVDDVYSGNYYIYWVDALGVEFLSLIQNILDNKYKGVYYNIDIGYANIPTITEFNKDFVVGRNHDCFRELDNLKHKGDYPYCIEKELEIVNKAVSYAVRKLEIYDRVIITSDHGSSRGAVLCKGKSQKTGENAKIERFGRYCREPSGSYEKIYAGCIGKDDYHVFANYDRFSIGGNERSEIHGGATLEEVLVPVIVLSRTPLVEKITVTPFEKKIKLRPGVIPKVKFKTNKDFDELYAVVDAKNYICKKEAGYWYFEPDIGKKEHYSAKILSKGNVGEFNYKIIKGRTDSDKFNI